jgi:hypothetical protein
MMMNGRNPDPTALLIDKLLRDVSDLKSENTVLIKRTNELVILFESLLTYMNKKGTFNMSEFESVIEQVSDEALMGDSSFDLKQPHSMESVKDFEKRNPLERTPLFKTPVGEA